MQLKSRINDKILNKTKKQKKKRKRRVNAHWMHIYLYMNDLFANNKHNLQKHRMQRSNHGKYYILFSPFFRLNYFGSATYIYILENKKPRIVHKWYYIVTRIQCLLATRLCMHKNIYVGAMCDLFKVPHIHWNTW